MFVTLLPLNSSRDSLRRSLSRKAAWVTNTNSSLLTLESSCTIFFSSSSITDKRDKVVPPLKNDTLATILFIKLNQSCLETELRVKNTMTKSDPHWEEKINEMKTNMLFTPSTLALIRITHKKLGNQVMNKVVG